MSSVINTNVMSLNAQRNMLKSTGTLANSMQRLSTGLRINGAKDDAAGLAISERMTGQINGMGQAIRNANDGISLSQTAEGALQAVTDSLQRIRQLAVQSGNSSNTQTDRDALNTEAQSLLKEIDRVAGQTQFNGQNLTDGTFTSTLFQVGANAGQTITVSSVTNATTAALGKIDHATVTGPANNGTTGIALGTATSTSTVDAADEGFLKIADANGVAHDIGALASAASIQDRMGQVVEAINNIGTTTGVNAYIEGDTIKLTSSHDIYTAGSDAGGVVTGIAVTTANADLTTGLNAAGAAGTPAVEAVEAVEASEGVAAVAAVAAVDEVAASGAVASGSTIVSGALNTLNISSYAASNLAIQQVDAALQRVNSDRASMGALQSRFQSVVTTLQTHSENLSAARSQIRDADFAAETANLTRGQILQQAGVAMLSQANSAPQSVLSLLKG